MNATGRTTIMTVIAAVLLTMLAASITRPSGATQDDALEMAVERLGMRVDDLTTRLARLEQASGSIPMDARSDSDSELPREPKTARRMIVDGIETRSASAGSELRTGRFGRPSVSSSADYVEDYTEDIRTVEREIRSLEQTIRSQQEQVTQLSGRRAGTQNNRKRVDAQVAAERRLLTQYQRELKRKERDLLRLIEAQRADKQTIVGHDGETIIYLHTHADLSAALAEVSVGDAIAWRGQRTEMDESAETWTVDRIRKLEE